MPVQPPAAPRCQHIMDSGNRCGSPALRGFQFCYWHQRNQHAATETTPTIPILEDGASIQIAATQVFRQLMSGKISPHQATAAFYGLQIIVMNDRNVQVRCDSEQAAEATPPMLPRLGTPDYAVEPQNLVMVSEDSARNAVMVSEGERPSRTIPSVLTPAPNVSGNSNHNTAGHPEEDVSPTKGLCILAPEHFLTAPLQAPEVFMLREQLFPPDAIRAYWTQHLPPDVASLEFHNELVYDPPTWLPLTDDEIAFLREHSQDDTHESETYRECLIFHRSREQVVPPTAEEIRANHEQLLKSDKFDAESIQDALRLLIATEEARKKKPKSA
jgi:hypothetical protein